MAPVYNRHSITFTLTPPSSRTMSANDNNCNVTESDKMRRERERRELEEDEWMLSEQEKRRQKTILTSHWLAHSRHTIAKWKRREENELRMEWIRIQSSCTRTVNWIRNDKDFNYFNGISATWRALKLLKCTRSFSVSNVKNACISLVSLSSVITNVLWNCIASNWHDEIWVNLLVNFSTMAFVSPSTRIFESSIVKCYQPLDLKFSEQVKQCSKVFVEIGQVFQHEIHSTKKYGIECRMILMNFTIRSRVNKTRKFSHVKLHGNVTATSISSLQAALKEVQLLENWVDIEQCKSLTFIPHSFSMHAFYTIWHQVNAF